MNDVTDVAGTFPEFDSHQSIFRLENQNLGIVGFIAIHRKRGDFPSLGATRLWEYKNEEEALRDALRLSKLMSYKSAFADLPYGGAKATLMFSKQERPSRIELFSWYTQQLNELKGMFVTGSDVGVEESDVSLMSKYSKFVIGNKVPAGYYTACGVFNAITLCLEKLYGTEEIAGRIFSIQGLGKTGWELIELLYPKAKKIYVSDIDPKKIQRIHKIFPNVATVSGEEIYTQKVDVFCPCALSYSINSQTEAKLKCKAIAGSANNQIDTKETERKIFERGIVYAVDYVANNGGLISVVDQFQHGDSDKVRILKKLLVTKNKLKNLFDESQILSLSPGVLADRHVEAVLNNIVYEIPQKNTTY